MNYHGTCNCLQCRSFPLTTSRCRKCNTGALGLDYDILCRWSYYDDTIEWECCLCHKEDEPMEVDEPMEQADDPCT